MIETAPQPILALRPEALKSREKAVALYEAALVRRTPTLKRVLKAAWAAVGLSALIGSAWVDKIWPAFTVSSAWSPVFYFLRGVLMVESFGYLYHRWFQHLGFWTRRAMVFRRNQRFHWMHHMILYPIGRFYMRDVPYISSEGGLGASWSVPGLMGAGLALYLWGFSFNTLAFAAGIAAYAILVVDDVHSRFHLAKHSYQGTRYFKWLEDIHLLHHWDQRMNFTIVHPAMDWLFGTYLAPRTNQAELKVAKEDLELTVSDLTNWRYLLLEATPVEYAAFISEARRHPRSIRKMGHLMEVLQHRTTSNPNDTLALELRRRAADLLNHIQGKDAITSGVA
jgi:hypothetical protein